jgi:hypothetical protein
MEFGIYRLPVYCIRDLSKATRIRLLCKVGVVLHKRLIHVFNLLWTVPLSENETPVPAVPQIQFGDEVTCLSMIVKPRNQNLTHQKPFCGDV